MRLAHGVAATLVVASSVWVTAAGAQSRTITTEPTSYARSEFATEYDGPNRGLLLGGMLTFGVPYVASFAVAATSEHPGDRNLLIPVAGPWLSLRERPACVVNSRTSYAACDTETTNQVLLIGNGIMQGLGALQIVGAFLFPERQVVSASIAATAITPKMTVSPAKVGTTGYGLSAFGSF